METTYKKEEKKTKQNISDIETKVDQILKENKHKLQNKTEKLDATNFSPKQKDSTSIYYLKEKETKKEKKKEKEFDASLSHEIMSVAREKLGEDPIEEPSEESADNKYYKSKEGTSKWYISRGKKKEKTDSDNKPKEDFFQTVEVPKAYIRKSKPKIEITKPIKEKKKEKTEEKTKPKEEKTPEKELSDFKEKYSKHIKISEEKPTKDKEKLAEEPTSEETKETKTIEIPDQISKISDEKSILDYTPIESPKKHSLFSRKKKEKIKDKKESKKKEKKKKELITKKDKVTKKDNKEQTFKVKSVSKTDDLCINETELLDKNIGSITDSKSDVVNKDQIVEEKAVKPTKSHSFFGKKKVDKKKKTKSIADEPLKKDTAPMFHVDKTPDTDGLSKDETDLLDKNIGSITDTKSKGVDEDKVVEEKAVSLAKSHSLFGKKKTKKKTIPLLDETPKEITKPMFHVDNASDADSLSKDETDLLDKNIKNVSDSKSDVTNKDHIVEEKAVELAKGHSVFGKKKVAKEKESPPTESIPPAQISEPIFRVDDAPESDKISKEETELLDEKISGITIVKEDSKIKEDRTINEEQELTETKTETHPAKKLFVEDEEAKEGFKPAFTASGENEGVEHVFFDEIETAFDEKPHDETEFTKPEMPTTSDVIPELDLEKITGSGEVELPKDALQVRSLTLENLGFKETEWEELDFYALYEPFSYVEILREKDSYDKRYFLVEIELTKEESEVLKYLKETLSNLTIDSMELETKGDVQYLQDKVKEIFEEYEVIISEESKRKVAYYLEKESLGLNKLDPLMKDPNIEDISCDGSNTPLFLYHRTYGSLKSNITFSDEEDLASFVVKLAQKCGKHISVAEPILDATMPDGSRIQMTLSTEVTTKGSTFTIRKFREDPFSPPDIIEFNTMSSEMMAYMWTVVENGVNALIAGGTASGKTSTLNALSLFIPREAKIVSIEETREINLPHPNWIPGVARSGFGEVVGDKMVGEIDMFDLMKAALRQRPEYILVGEIRGREAYVLFQAMATGHTTYSTAHADSAQSLIHRLEGKPINIPRIMLQALDIVCIQVTSRVKNKRARRCKQIIEIIDIDPVTKEILTNEVFRWDPVEDKFIFSGKSYVMERIRAEKDLSREAMTTELKNRASLLGWMNTKNIRDYRRVAVLLSQYLEKPEDIMKTIKKET